eukprot:scaffold34685_cov183-Amphora_coffeaeformis.AAC.15
MEKYGKVRRRVQDYVMNKQQQPSSSSSSVVISCPFQVSPLATVTELETTHDPQYIQRYLRGDMTDAEVRNVGFPWSPAGVNRSLSSVGGTVAAARHVVEQIMARRAATTTTTSSNTTTSTTTTTTNHGSQSTSALSWAAHVAGGTHHAFYDYGEGFCVFSDIAVAANVVLKEYAHVVRRILILDLDVHQGNGNAILFQNRPEVFTFSMQCAANSFSPKEVSDLDIELPVDCRDETYLLTLKHWLSRIQQEAGEFDLVFFQAGVDGLADDRLGRMALTAQGLARRNEMVYDFCLQQNLPLVITMGGGYPRKDWEPILAAHAAVYTGAYDFLAQVASSTTLQQDAETPDDVSVLQA